MSSFTPKFKEVEFVKTDSLIIHKLAEVNPPMSDEEVAAVVADMKLNGFAKDKPITVWGRHTKKIIDGRNRYNAAILAGITSVPVREMSSKTSLVDIKEWIAREERRRHQSPTQRAIQAWREKQESDYVITYEQLSIKYGIGVSIIEDVGKLSKVATKKVFEGIVDTLFGGGSIPVGGKPTKSVSGVLRGMMYKNDASEIIGSDAAQESAVLKAKKATQNLLGSMNPYEFRVAAQTMIDTADSTYPEVRPLISDPDGIFLKSVKKVSNAVRYDNISEDAKDKAQLDIKRLAKATGLKIKDEVQDLKKELATLEILKKKFPETVESLTVVSNRIEKKLTSFGDINE